MTDKISQQPVPPLDPPERFAGGEVVAAARCPVDVSTYPPAARDRGQARWRAADVLSPRGGPQPCWVGGQGQYKLGYAAAIRLMAEKVVGWA
jgi:hypothetical protein